MFRKQKRGRAICLDVSTAPVLISVAFMSSDSRLRDDLDTPQSREPIFGCIRFNMGKKRQICPSWNPQWDIHLLGLRGPRMIVPQWTWADQAWIQKLAGLGHMTSAKKSTEKSIIFHDFSLVWAVSSTTTNSEESFQGWNTVLVTGWFLKYLVYIYIINICICTCSTVYIYIYICIHT